jgi:hypothetical protein
MDVQKVIDKIPNLTSKELSNFRTNIEQQLLKDPTSKSLQQIAAALPVLTLSKVRTICTGLLTWDAHGHNHESRGFANDGASVARILKTANHNNSRNGVYNVFVEDVNVARSIRNIDEARNLAEAHYVKNSNVP